MGSSFGKRELTRRFWAFVLRCFAFDRVISARTWMLPMLMREPELLPKFFNYYVRPPSLSLLFPRSSPVRDELVCKESEAHLSLHPSPHPSPTTSLRELLSFLLPPSSPRSTSTEPTNSSTDMTFFIPTPTGTSQWLILSSCILLSR